jgi:hypothetical protein
VVSDRAMPGDAERIAARERENRELHRANELLTKK